MSNEVDVVSGNAVLKYCLLAKSSKGKACAAVIQQALSNPHTFVFGELLDMPNVKALAETPENKPWFEALSLFAYGTYSDFKAQTDKFPELSEPLLKKLKQLSVVSIAAVQKSIPYVRLLQELEISNVRELEDLIIDCIYAGLIRGKLDQKQQRFQVDWVMGRDIRPGQIEDMIQVLTAWCEKSEELMEAIQEKVKTANLIQEQHKQEKKVFEEKVESIKEGLKAAMAAEMSGDFDGADMSAFGFGGANKKGRNKPKGQSAYDQPNRRK
ncbi:COP9 signalosome complex subunit 7b [Balamuthia mandrillaris]